MPSKRRKDSIPAFDYREMLEITSTQDCQIVVISPETYQLCCSALRLAEYPTRWRNLTDLDDNPVNVELAISLYHQAVKELTMGCDLEGFNSELNRIANSLESIDAKMAERITYDEIIEDLETTLGISNIFVSLIKFVGDMIPNVRLKLDMSWLPMAIWEYFTWKAPLIALLTGMNASLAGSAAAALAAAPLGIIKTVTAVMDTITNVSGKLHDFWLGDWNWMDDVLNPIWNSFISDGEGGTGGDDPDTDPDKRISVNINTSNVDNNVFNPTINVSCSSCGGGGCSDCGVGSAPVVDPDPAEGQPDPGYPDPENPPPGYETDGTPAYDVYKCSAANYLFNAYLTYVDNHSNISGIVTTYTTSILSLMGANLFFAPFGPTVQFLLGAISTGFLWSYLLTVLPGIAGLGALFASYKANLEDDRPTFICELVEAQDVAEARAVIEAHITDTMPVGLPSDWVQMHIDNLFTNNVLNILFTFYQPASEVAAEDCTCGCLEYQPDPESGANPGTEIVSSDDTTVIFKSVGIYTDRERYDRGIHVNKDAGMVICGPSRTLTSISYDVTPVGGGSATLTLEIYTQDILTQLWTPSSDVTPDLPIENVGYVNLISANDVTVTCVFE